MRDLPPQPLPGLPGLLGITLIEASADRVEAVLTVGPEHLAPTGYLHAACVVALADTTCGYGCLAALPVGKVGFTTIELKSNHLATAPLGEQLRAVATPVHGGRTTQVWDAIVTAAATGDQGHRRQIAVFRCTQMLLERKPSTPKRCCSESFDAHDHPGRRASARAETKSRYPRS
jgi:1,4-dihydroxy-2-naphthoyl-CoA hydrolase